MTVSERRMQIEELQGILAFVGWTRVALARRIGRSHNFIPNMLKGECRVPQPYAAWFRQMEALHRGFPFPQIKRREAVGTMTPAELIRSRELLCWPYKTASRHFGISFRSVQAMALGNQSIPASMSVALRMLRRAYDDTPPPGGWAPQHSADPQI